MPDITFDEEYQLLLKLIQSYNEGLINQRDFKVEVMDLIGSSRFKDFWLGWTNAKRSI